MPIYFPHSYHLGFHFFHLLFIYFYLFVQTLALQTLCDEDVRKGFSQSSLTEKLVPKACKESCLNKDPNVKVMSAL